MTNLLCDFVFGNKNFGLNVEATHPYFSLFGLEIYLYAIVIVTGMCLAILIAGLYFKKRGYDPYDITIYALAVIPIGVLGARAYVYIFPWSGQTADWSTYFDFRSGGLGIYGGVILGYLAALVCAKIKKQDFRIVADAIMPGLFLAQSLGRWGNFFNQEAYGNLITNDYNALPNFFEWINHSRRHGFNGYAVWIGNDISGGWYQATFFYESVCTLIGFIICVAVLTRSKHYKLGWCAAFYGIYYGIVRLVIEGFRTDSLYLYIGTMETDIKISQLVSVFAILFGVMTLTKIYRKELHALYKKMFKNDYDEMSKSRWILLAISVVSLGVGITMFVLGGESKFIAGAVLTAVAVYSALGVWSLFDRMKLYCKDCKECGVPVEQWQTPHEKLLVQVVCYAVIMGLLFAFGLFSLINWGIISKIPNGTVLFVVCMACIAALAIWKFVPSLKQFLATPETKGSGNANCQCGTNYPFKLNKFLLFVFPPKVYLDYGVENLKPYVDPDADKKAAKKKAKAEARANKKAENNAQDTNEEE